MPRKPSKTLPTVGEVVIVTFPVGGTLGVWSGKSWFIWRKTNAGMTGEPNNWHPCEDNLIRDWSEIPPGVLHTIIPDGAGPYEGMTVEHKTRPYKTVCDWKARGMNTVGTTSRGAPEYFASISGNPDGVRRLFKAAADHKARMAGEAPKRKRNNPGFRRA